jgi:hypothetical protein
MKERPLTQGEVAIVDDADFEWLNQWKWCATRRRHTWYAVRHEAGTHRVFLMHRQILGLGFGDQRQGDHRDGNGLNNTRLNLRVATVAQNNYNQRVREKAGKPSRFKGVYPAPHGQSKWVAQIRVAGRTIPLGTFNDEGSAAQAYNRAAVERFGQFARLNEI